jgi:hypothetical protein
MMTKNGTAMNPVPALKKGEPAPPIEGHMKAEFAQLIAPMQATLTELATSSPELTAAHQ